jgi:hypothetical protein
MNYEIIIQTSKFVSAYSSAQTPPYPSEVCAVSKVLNGVFVPASSQSVKNTLGTN